MTEEQILDFLIHATDEQKRIFAKSVMRACDLLAQVRTGEDFECECWDGVAGVKAALGLSEDEE